MMNKKDVEVLTKDLFGLTKQQQDTVILAENEAKKDVKNADLKAKVAKETETLQILERSLNVVKDSMNAIVEAEKDAKNNETKNAKKIKVISNRRLMFKGRILEHKQIVNIDNDDKAKHNLELGLISVV